MTDLARRLSFSAPVVFGGVVLYGVAEFVALQRRQRRQRRVRPARAA